MKFSLAIISALAALASASPLVSREDGLQEVDALDVATIAPTDDNLVAGITTKAVFQNFRVFDPTNYRAPGLIISGTSRYFLAC